VSYTATVWGARGSIPTPGESTVRYGGNTSCIQVQADGVTDRAVILDAGSGIRPLGNALLVGGNPVQVDLLLTHTHWDHIQGFPFFAPMFVPGNALRIWGAKQSDVDLESILRDQMNPVVFPVPLDKMPAALTVQHIGPGGFEVDGFQVDAFRLRHPGTTLGYRLEPIGGGGTLAYITDNELGPGGEYDMDDNWRAKLIDFVAGVDLLIHDAMYGPGDIGQHLGWGHSSYDEAVVLAAEARVKRLMLFHHRPERTDAEVDESVRAAQAHADRSGHSFEVIAAAEGMQLCL
jgi:phosphoribosyl 1,2-cyclic phosphodiesterase